MNLVHEFGAWWFFADTGFSPAAIFGAVCLGAWLHRGYRRLWPPLPRSGMASVDVPASCEIDAGPDIDYREKWKP